MKKIELTKDYKPNIAVVFPSRGLAFSATCEELVENLEGFEHTIYFSHRKPIPEAFNEPTERALANKAHTHFFFVEDDMILPKNVLKTLLKAKVPAICCDYPVTYQGKASVYRDSFGNAIYGGTGCLLVTREFIEAYKKPVFRTDIAWDIKIGDRLEATPRKIKGDLYGLHDVTFGLLAYQRGTPIKVSKIHCGQRKLKALGQAGTNNGEHLIQTWTELTPETLKLKKIVNRNVLLKDGTLVFMDIKRAKVLEVEGKASILPDSYVELIDNDVLEELL